jgi:hypothetical protein
MAIRGVFGMYLASDLEWDRSNLLSKEYWRTLSHSADEPGASPSTPNPFGGANEGEAKIADFLGVEIMRERESAQLKGVKIGERWAPAVQLVGAVVGVLGELGARLRSGCLGEEVGYLLSLEGEEAGVLAERFCRLVSGLIRADEVQSAAVWIATDLTGRSARSGPG